VLIDYEDVLKKDLGWGNMNAKFKQLKEHESKKFKSYIQLEKLLNLASDILSTLNIKSPDDITE